MEQAQATTRRQRPGARRAGAEGGTAPRDQGGSAPCATFEQASALTGSAGLPLWALGAAAMAAFGLGVALARRRRNEVDPTG
jgi:hypothetical protein